MKVHEYRVEVRATLVIRSAEMLAPGQLRGIADTVVYTPRDEASVSGLSELPVAVRTESKVVVSK